MGGGPKECSFVATPARRRSFTRGESQSAGTAAGDGLPAKARGLSWPSSFCEEPRGERLELADGSALASRASGVGRGIVFLGPLSLENGTAYFEIELAEMEKNRSQTLGIGICTSLPADTSVRAERASNLGEGTHLLGYDLPKVFSNGTEVSKINTKEWRPLKELAVGDRVGLLIERKSMELTVFVNGTKKACASGLGGSSPHERWPTDIWGVVDLHGTVKAARLRGPAAARRQLRHQDTLLQGLPAPPAARSLDSPDLGATQELPAPPCGRGRSPRPPLATQDTATKDKEVASGFRRPSSRAGLESAGSAKKRARTTAFPCGCMVHLTRHTGEVVHVPQDVEFVIGRQEKTCHIVLESPVVPRMASRRHAVISCTQDSVILQDCRSCNGTYVNGRRVGHVTLLHGDKVIIGNPAQSPRDFHFRISTPAAA